MRYVQILDCSSVLGTCCSDYGLVNILDIIRQALEFIQLVAPIVLIVALAIQFTQMLVSPDDKKGMKKLTNKFIAIIVCFLLPTAVNVLIGLMPQTETFQLSACWKTAEASREVMNSQKSTYIKSPKNSYSILTNPAEYALGNKNPGGSGNGSATGKAIVELAKTFVGNRYCWGGKDPNTCADCSGFVSYIFAQFGISLISQTDAMWGQTDMYDVVGANEIQAGDVVMYNGHVGILTGNGNEIVHAKSTNAGIVIDPDYTTCSGHNIMGIMRIKGVN